MKRRRRWLLLLVLLVACGAEVRFDPSPSCSFRADRADRPVDASAPLPKDPIALALGQRHACAVRADDSIVCWGANDLGQLGVADDPERGYSELHAGQPVTSLVAGGAHSCAGTTDGEMLCWGDGSVGQTGPNGGGTRGMVIVPGAGRTFLPSAGLLHTCALRLDGRGPVCWGDNRFGQLGRDAGGVDPMPRLVTLDGSVRVIAAGAFHTCALVQDPAAPRSVISGSVWCWGRDEDGELGDGEPGGSRSEPQLVSLPGPASAVVAGAHHTCARVGVETVCWGRNASGELGIGEFTESEPPMFILERANRDFHVLGGTFSLSADPATGELVVGEGTGHSCTYRYDRSRFLCWGANDEGQLADGTRTTRAAPIDEDELDAGVGVDATTAASPELEDEDDNDDDVRTFHLGGPFGCALAKSHDVWCWGSNDHGILLRSGEDALAPERILLPEQQP